MLELLVKKQSLAVLLDVSEIEVGGTGVAFASFLCRFSRMNALCLFDSIHGILLLVESRLSIPDKTSVRVLNPIASIVR